MSSIEKSFSGGVMSLGKMVVCDGGNGAGKTTVLKAIENYLLEKGYSVLMTREPGGTAVGERIREILLAPELKGMNNIAELMLFTASRAQHVAEKIRPALAEGKFVISDRFDSATYSFQHYARGICLNTINTLNELALDGFKPDLNIILDLDPLTGLERVMKRSAGELDRFEQENIDFLGRARQGYLKLAADNPDSFVVINAQENLDVVVANAIKAVDTLL